jgi:hypothetical protein
VALVHLTQFSSTRRRARLEPGTTFGADHLIEAHSPYLGGLNDSPTLRAESVEGGQDFFEIDLLLVGHAEIVSLRPEKEWTLEP